MSNWFGRIFNKGDADGTPAPGRRRLRVAFVYADALQDHPLTQAFAPPAGAVVESFAVAAAVAPVLVEAAVGLASKAVVSLLDAVAAKTQAEAVTVETTLPVEGFYNADGTLAVAGGCLVFHNGDDDQGRNASLLSVMSVTVSPDQSAFRLTVRRWEHTKFLSEHPTQALQKEGERDVVLKIEFLTPGSSGFGNRAVFIEQVYPAVNLDELEALLEDGHEFAWFAAPVRPALATGAPAGQRLMPFNLRVTLVETTEPNKLAAWVQTAVADNKAKLGTLAGTLVHNALDPAGAEVDRAKLAPAAGTAYDAYKAGWDDLLKHTQAKPADTADQVLKDKWATDLLVKRQLLVAKKTIAQAAFSTAGLGWPGDLPAL